MVGSLKDSSIKKTIFSIAIAILTVFFVAYATTTIYPGPKHDDFCNSKIREKPVALANTKEICEDNEGVWKEYPKPDLNNQTGWCDYSACWNNFNDARKPYERNLFIINIILGVALLIGAYFLIVEAVSSGLMGGGVLLLIYGSIRYWNELPDILRTIILGIALASLIWTGYKKLK